MRLLFAILLLITFSAHAKSACVTSNTVNTSICSGQTYSVGAHNYSSSGSYIDTLTGSGGCDSIIFTTLKVDTAITQTLNLLACNQVTYGGNVYPFSTVVNRRFQYPNGCDSFILTVNIIVTYTSVFVQSPLICQGQTILVGVKSYGSSGFYTDTLHNAALGGCDSIIHTDLTVISPYTSSLLLSDTCIGSYKGRTYTSSVVIQDTIASQITGCDSVYLTVTLDIVPPILITNNKSVRLCPGQSYFAGGQNRSTAGLYSDTTLTISGCDSIITNTALSFIHPQYISHSYDTCTAVTINSISYASDTVIADTTLSSLGCDSLIRTDSVHIKATSITVLSTALLPITQGDSTQLIIYPTGNYQNIVWSPNQWITNRYLANPVVLPDVNTAYMVTAQDSSHCTINGQIIVTVTPSDIPNFVMPTAFTPNGDGMNDLFGPILNPYAHLASYHIYNRWGELVFDKDANGTDQWDGTYHNVSQPAGIYMYFISITSFNGRTKCYEGNFSLQR